MKTGISALLLAAFLVSAISTGSSGQTAVTVPPSPTVVTTNGKALAASNVLKLSADTERSGSIFVPDKKFLVPFAGIVRVKWQLKSDGSGQPANIRVVTGIDICSASHPGPNYKAGTCDIRVVAGDIVHVQGSGTPTGVLGMYSTAFIRNVRLYYNVVDATGLGQTLVD